MSKKSVSLRDSLQANKRNEHFLSLFHLPTSETVESEFSSRLWLSPIGYVDGEVIVSQNFLCLHATDVVNAVIPFMLFKKLQKVCFSFLLLFSTRRHLQPRTPAQLNTDTVLGNSVSIGIREIPFPLLIEVVGSRDDFCQDMKDHIQRIPKGADGVVENFVKANDMRKNSRSGLGHVYGFVGDIKQ